MSVNFYDKVAKRFGGYGYGIGPNYQSVYPGGNPEKIFKEQLLSLGSKNKKALDIGCADGKFTLAIAPFFKKVYGIDTSKINLDLAKNHGGENVEYSLQDASHTSFPDVFFDVAYCRRGPTYYSEYHRLLKTTGYYLEIGIGEMDTIKLKKVFGRGQNFGKWDQSKLEENLSILTGLGFKVIFAENFHYFEYYPSVEEFDLFLQGVPIFEDYHPEKDKTLLQKYVNKFTTKKGIQLPRHRIVMVIQKLP